MITGTGGVIVLNASIGSNPQEYLGYGPGTLHFFVYVTPVVSSGRSAPYAFGALRLTVPSLGAWRLVWNVFRLRRRVNRFDYLHTVNNLYI
jgi:hypothetical protein